MASYRRTKIRRLTVQGYRSLRVVKLVDLPEILVFYGPNGSGKSNLLRAAQLALRAATLEGPLPRSRDEAWKLPIAVANQKLGLRPEDFTAGQLPEIRVELEVELGDRARPLLGALRLDGFRLHVVFQDGGDRTLRCWFEAVMDLAGNSVFENLAAAEELKEDEQLRALVDPIAAVQLKFRSTLLREKVQREALLLERFRNVLLPGLLQSSGAYRTPGTPEDPTERLYAALLSEDQRVVDAALGLGRQLAAAGLFGTSGPIELRPVDSASFGEKQLRLRHPRHGLLPLRNLGTGQQQLIFLLAQQVINPAPIGALEEPEAHLHVDLMKPLSRALRAAVFPEDGPPAVDQLWLATHHHLFALADDFFEVRLDEHGDTQVERKPRDAAAAHFYEPSPYWDTLELLVKNGMPADTVVHRDADGQSYTAGQVLASLRGDRELARRFVDAATRAFVQSLGDPEPCDP